MCTGEWCSHRRAKMDRARAESGCEGISLDDRSAVEAANERRGLDRGDGSDRLARDATRGRAADARGAPGADIGRGGHTPTQFGSGPVTIDFAFPAPEPAPVTTIAWRLAHIIVGCFGMRVASHFGGPVLDYATFPYAATAREALAQLDAGYAAWLAGVRSWSDADLAEPVGPAEGPFAALPRSTLVLHIQREVIHHGAEIALLRDLWANGLR